MFLFLATQSFSLRREKNLTSFHLYKSICVTLIFFLEFIGSTHFSEVFLFVSVYELLPLVFVFISSLEHLFL